MPKGPKKGSPSNNPAGRPPKERSLTEAIKRALDVALPGDAHSRTRKEVQAALLAQGVSEGIVEFPDGRTEHLTAREWIDLNFRLLTHVEPPRQEVDVTQQSTVKGYIGFSPAEWDDLAGDE